MFWMVVFSPEENYGEIFEAQTGAVVTCLLDRQNPRRSSISPVTEKLPCYFFLCSDLLSLIVGLGWVVVKKGVPFSFQNPLFFFKVQWWFSTHQHEHYTRPPLNLGPRCLRLLFKWSQPGCGLQIARMVGWCTAFSSDLWPRRLAGFGKKETYEQLIFFEAYPEKTEKSKVYFCLVWWIRCISRTIVIRP